MFVVISGLLTEVAYTRWAKVIPHPGFHASVFQEATVIQCYSVYLIQHQGLNPSGLIKSSKLNHTVHTDETKKSTSYLIKTWTYCDVLSCVCLVLNCQTVPLSSPWASFGCNKAPTVASAVDMVFRGDLHVCSVFFPEENDLSWATSNERSLKQDTSWTPHGMIKEMVEMCFGVSLLIQCGV